MKKLALVFTAMAFGAGVAWAQNPGASTAPALQYYMGPSLGNLYLSPGTFLYGSINAQTGTTYTVVATDFGKLLTFTNGSAITVTLPVATSFSGKTGQCFAVTTEGAGTATITPTTSTINGQSTKAYATGAGGTICSDGTNYHAF